VSLIRFAAVIFAAVALCRGAVDPEAARILGAVSATLTNARTAEVALHLAVKTPTAPTGNLSANYRLSVERPNRLALVLDKGDLGATVISDGTNIITFLPKPAVYTMQKAPARIGAIESAGDMGSMAFITALFSTNVRSALLAGVLEAKYAGREKVDNTDCERIDMKQEGLDWRLFTTLGSNTLVRRIEVTIPQLSMSMDFTDWKLNAAIPADRFLFVPPEGAKKVDRLLDDEERDGEDSELIDEPFPRLKLKTLDGDTFDTATVKGKPALLVVWAGEAAHCAEALKSIADLAASRKGVAAYSINVDEKPDRKRIKGFLGKMQIKTAIDERGEAIDKLQVEGVPMTFLIDKEGVVRKAFLGFHPEFRAVVGKELDAMAK
jgi:peroxiredoxin